MNSKLTLLVTFLLLRHLAPAQALTRSDAIARGLGNNAVTLVNAWSVQNNQACLAQVKRSTAGIAYENPYLLHQLSSKAIALAHPISSGSIGLLANWFGYALYSEQAYSLCYGRQLNKQLSMGMALSWQQLKLGKDYGQKNSLTGSVGFLARLNDKLFLGGHVYNLNQARLIDQYNERLPTVQRLGVRYLLSGITQLMCEIEKTATTAANVKAGLDYQPAAPIHFRAGINTDPVNISFGTGLQLSNVLIDLAFTYHPVLGYQPVISLIWPSASDDE